MSTFSGTTMMTTKSEAMCSTAKAGRANCDASNSQFGHLAVLLLSLILAWSGTANADYGFDPGFNPNYTIDAFATGENGGAFRSGERLVTLPDGDIVVAGAMRFPNDPLMSSFINVGLVRYSPSGIRKTWTGPAGPYSWFNRQYIVYPNTANGSSGDTRITYVADIGQANGKIYVLIERRYESSPFDADSSVLVFNDDGSFIEQRLVLGSTDEEWAVALDVRETGIASAPVAVTVLGNFNFSNFAVAKFVEAPDGFLATDSTFNGGLPLTIILPACSFEPVCAVSPVDIVRPDRLFGLDQEPIYLLGTVSLSGTDRDMLVIKVLANGVIDTSWGLNGQRFIAYDQSNSDLSDTATALVVSSVSAHSGFDDTVWVSGTVNRSCKPGIGIAKLQPDGQFDPSFGSNGRVVYGGSIETGSICEFDTALSANAMTLQDGELAVAGTASALDQGGTERTDGMLLTVGANSASLHGIDALPLVQNGARVGDSFPYGVQNAGNGRYLVSGFGEWTGVYGSLYISARLWLADRIFANSFESQGGSSR
jgi:hypothetical protein